MKTKVGIKKKQPILLRRKSDHSSSASEFNRKLDDIFQSIQTKAESPKASSSESDIPLPKHLDDAKLKLLCTHPKEMKYNWDVMKKYQEDEIEEKEKEREVKKEEPPICIEMKEQLSELHDLILDGTESVTNVKYAAAKKESIRAEDEKEYRLNLEKMYLEADKKAKEELKAIGAAWEGLKQLQNPLEIDRGTKFLKDKCDALLRSRDELINYLKDELKKKDDKFVYELEKQSVEIDVLVDRIEEQISVLKEAYTVQLEKLEEIIDKEKGEIIANNRKIWEALIKERDDIDRAAIDTIYKLVEDHERKIDMGNIELNEKQRALDIDLNKIIHKMTLELDHLRSMCALNIEKISYNYQLLLKRQKENQMIKSQNKKRIVQLRSDIETVKNKIKTGTIALAKDITGHVSAIETLQQNIRDIEQRSAFLAAANSKKYFELWDFNQKRAEELLHQIFAGDKVLFEQVLYVPWKAPTEISFPKGMMPCYREGLKLCGIARKQRLIKPKFEVTEDEEEDKNTLNLLRIVLKNLPSACSFFIDPLLNENAEHYSSEDKLLLQLDPIFSALAITNKRDMQLLAKYFARYITCPDCKRGSFEIKANKMVQTEDRKYLQSLLSKQNKSSAASSAESDGEVEAKIPSESDDTFVLTDRIKYHLKIIAGTVYEEVHHSFGELEPSGEILDKTTDVEETDLSEIRKQDIIEKHKLFGLSSKEYPIDWFVSNLKQECFEDQSPEDKKADSNEITIVRAYDQHIRLCDDPSHHPTIDPIDVARAVKEFATDFFRANRTRKNKTLEEIKNKMKITLARCMEEKDVENYWNSFLEMIPKEKIDLWDTMYTAMQDYHKALQKRHNLNEEIRKLKKSNYELRRLLQRYIEKEGPKEEEWEYFKDLEDLISLEKETPLP